MPTSTMRARSLSTSAVTRVYKGIAWHASKTLQSWGLHGSVVKTTKGQSTDYDAAFSVRLPLAWWFGSHILKGELAMSFPPRTRLRFGTPATSLCHASLIIHIHSFKLAETTMQLLFEICCAMVKGGLQTRLLMAKGLFGYLLSDHDFEDSSTNVKSVRRSL